MTIFTQGLWFKISDIRLSWPLTLNSIEHVQRTARDEPHPVKNTVMSHGAPFMKTRLYIFLTEWQLCAKHVDPGVPQSARGVIKLTARGTHGPQCPRYGGKVAGTVRSFRCPVALWTKGFVSVYDKSEIAAFRWGPTLASPIHLSNTDRLLEKGRQRSRWWLEETSLCWQKFSPMLVVYKPMTRSTEWIHPGLVWKPRRLSER